MTINAEPELGKRAKKTKVELAVETDAPALEGRQMSAETEEGGCATIEEIRKGLFGFMPAVTQHMHFPGACSHT